MKLLIKHGFKSNRDRGMKEGNVLFNDALNTFYLRLYGIGHMVKDHSDSERGNLLPPHGLLFPINSKVFYMHHPTDRIIQTSSSLAGTRNSSMGSPHEGSIRRPIAPWANALTMEVHLAPEIKDIIPCSTKCLWCFVCQYHRFAWT